MSLLFQNGCTCHIFWAPGRLVIYHSALSPKRLKQTRGNFGSPLGSHMIEPHHFIDDRAWVTFKGLAPGSNFCTYHLTYSYKVFHSDETARGKHNELYWLTRYWMQSLILSTVGLSLLSLCVRALCCHKASYSCSCNRSLPHSINIIIIIIILLLSYTWLLSDMKSVWC